jgi:hypothetical protein
VYIRAVEVKKEISHFLPQSCYWFLSRCHVILRITHNAYKFSCFRGKKYSALRFKYFKIKDVHGTMMIYGVMEV